MHVLCALRIVTVGCLVLQSNTPDLQLDNFCRNGEVPELKELFVVPAAVKQELQQ